jgi:hypothetical protein
MNAELHEMFNRKHCFSLSADKNFDKKVFLSKLYAYDIPSNWIINVYGSSVLIASPKGKLAVKVDSSKRVFIDQLISGRVKSSSYTHESINDAWLLVESTLNNFLKREGCSNATRGIAESAA